MKKICVITGTRAEYGLLRWVMEEIKGSNVLTLNLIVCGMHLSPEFGLTIKQIEEDGFKVNKKIEMLLSSDTPASIAKSMGIGLISFADALEDLKPDLIMVLGDRYEILSAASAALVARIPVAHLHGGESTEGCIDEAIRHSITKMSHIHFVACNPYQKRVIQLGEQPSTVFNVGGLGIDNILKLNLLDKNKLEQSLDFEFRKKNFLITFHPVTLESNTSEEQMNQLLESLSSFEETGFIFTMPNSDTHGRILFAMIKKFAEENSNAKYFTSLGQLRYLSCIQQTDLVIGNSSSGIIEAPTFRKPTINIGDRQKGRIKADSIIDCKPEKESIINAIKKAISVDFQESVKKTINPYGNGGASSKIVKILEEYNFDDIIKKNFYNLNQ